MVANKKHVLTQPQQLYTFVTDPLTRATQIVCNKTSKVVAIICYNGRIIHY